MKIKYQSVFVNVENEVVMGNGAITATFVHQLIVDKNCRGEIDVCIEFTDTENVTFMGMPIEIGYAGFKKFKQHLKEMGIDYEQMENNAEKNLDFSILVGEIKSKYKSVL
jgi:hypothetical protein